MPPNLEIHAGVGDFPDRVPHETVVVASWPEQEGSMAETCEHNHAYERPRIEARAAIGATLIGNTLASNADVFESAAFTHI
jgi:hypothetical protein